MELPHRAIAPVLMLVGALSSGFSFGEQWTRLDPTGGPLPPRGEPTVTYDPVRNQVLVFGGRVNLEASRNDVWRLSLDGSPTWTHIVPAGTPPTPRKGAAGVYDSARDRLVLFGGYQVALDVIDAARNDVWALDLSNAPRWYQLETSGDAPAPRQNATMVYDPISDRLVLFGGRGNGNCAFGDTWELSLQTLTWKRIADSGDQPGQRVTTGVYDPVARRMLIFGGMTSVTLACGQLTEYSDLWELSLIGRPAWQLVNTEGTPPLPLQRVSVYDPINRSMWVYRGSSPISRIRSDSTHSLRLGAQPLWTLASTSDAPPSSDPWSSFNGTYDSKQHRIIGLSEEGLRAIQNEVWGLKLPIFAISAGIDIHPDSYVNTINPRSHGVIPVAILGSDTFRVANIDVTSLAFGPHSASATHNLEDSFIYNDHVQDVNLDGFADLVAHFRTQETGITCWDETATLTAKTLDGQRIEGSDSIDTVGWRDFGRPSISLKIEEPLDQLTPSPPAPPSKPRPPQPDPP